MGIPSVPSHRSARGTLETASGTRRQPSAGDTCKASRMSLSEISVAKDLAPEVLKVAWMILFLSLSSCEQRQGGSQSRPPLREAFQMVDLHSFRKWKCLERPQVRQ